MSHTHLRYPGAQPFETKQKGLFFGREKTAQKLYRLIKLEPLVVLHSKSGLGKSSLLNAAIIPKIIDDDKYVPLRIRFNAYVDGAKNKQPLQMTSEVVRGGGQSASTFLDKLIPDENTLWHDIKEHQIQSKNQKNIILLFDQFEELFTYPKKAIDAFGKQLIEALSVTLPQRYWNRLENMEDGELNNDELQLLQQAPHLKIVMAIRSDKMSLLDNLSDHLPSILKTCFELKPLSVNQAKEAILLPAQAAGVFASEPFDYDKPALDNILDFLAQDNKDGIESTQLQIVCTAMEKKAMTNSLSLIQLSDTENLGDLIKKYYDEKISLLKTAEQQEAARHLIEDELIFESEERRISLYEGQILSSGVTAESLRILVDSHLLRSEPSPQGGFTYELSHDTLVVPVLKAKRNRMAILERETREQERQARMEELKEARQKAAEEKQRAEEQAELRAVAERGELRARQRTRLATGVSILAMILAGLSFFFWNSTNAALSLAEEQKQMAMKNDSIAQVATADALDQKEEAEIQTQFALATSKKLNDSERISKAKAIEAQRNLEMLNERISSFFVSKTEAAFNKEDIRLALLLNDKALEKNEKNNKAKDFYKKLPFYTSQYFLDKQSYKLNTDSSFIAIKGQTGITGSTLDVLPLKENGPPQVFENCLSYNFSSDGEYLSFWTVKERKKKVKKKGFQKDEEGSAVVITETKIEKHFSLNILSLNNKTPLLTIDDCIKGSDQFSKNNKYVAVWKESKQKEKQTLFVLDLTNPKAVRDYKGCVENTERFSSDSKYLTFLTDKSDDNLATLNVLSLDDSAPPRTFKNCDVSLYPKLDREAARDQNSDIPEFHTVKKSDTVWGLSRKYGLAQTELKKLNNLKSNTIHLNQKLRLRLPVVDNFSGSTTGAVSKYLSFWTKTNGVSKTDLNVLELNKQEPPRIIKNVYSQYFRYSNNHKHLAYWSKGDTNTITTLNLLPLDGTDTAKTFENVKNMNFRFTNDSKRAIFWTTVEGCNNLQIISLDGASENMEFKNSDPMIDRFSYNDQFFLFWTEPNDHEHSASHAHKTLNVLDLSGANPLRTYNDSYKSLFHFSNDSEYLTFWTKNDHTLNVLKLNGGTEVQTFENTSEFRYSSNGKYMNFLQESEHENQHIVQVLELSTNKLIISHNCISATRFNFSRDSKHLTYFTKDKEGDFTILNVRGISDPTYSRSFEKSFGPYISPDNGYLLFKTVGLSGNSLTLNLIELGSHKPVKKFEHCLRNYFSREGKYLSYVEKRPDEDFSRFKVVDVQNGLLVEEIHHQYKVKSIRYLGQNKFLTSSIHPLTDGVIYKIVEPAAKEKTYDYCMSLYPSLTKLEKEEYGVD